MSLELATVDAALLPLNEDSPDNAFVESLDMLDAVAARVKELRDQWKAAALERCQSRGDMLLGHRRFYAGKATETWCDDVPATVLAIYDAAAGDFDVMAGCLSANALKSGATRKVLSADVFARLFRTEDKVRLKDGEPTKKQLMEIDTRYLR